MTLQAARSPAQRPAPPQPPEISPDTPFMVVISGITKEFGSYKDKMPDMFFMRDGGDYCSAINVHTECSKALYLLLVQGASCKYTFLIK